MHDRVPLVLLRPRRGADRDIRHLAQPLTERAHRNDAGEHGTAKQRQIQSRRQS